MVLQTRLDHREQKADPVRLETLNGRIETVRPKGIQPEEIRPIIQAPKKVTLN
jgi:hypothetical protein